MRHQGYSFPPTSSNHSRAMVVLTFAIIGVVLCGMISQIAPRPQTQVRPIVHQHVPADVAHIEASAAG